MAAAHEEFVVIVAGGTGTRLWPWSRKNLPKQFLKLFGNQSFLEQVYQRAQKVVDSKNIFIVAPESYSQFISQYLPDFPLTNFMGEPTKKGTTAAYGYTATYIKQLNPNAIVHIIAADDYIIDINRYRRSLGLAAQLVKEKDCQVIYGVKPRDPNPGYGYVKVKLKDWRQQGEIEAYGVESFHEKPPLETAKQYLTDKSYFWHTFGFTITVSKLLSLIQTYDPETAKVLEAIEADLKLPSRIEQVRLAEHYQKLKESNIENQILEKELTNTYMVTLEETWSDIGTWDHIFSLKEKNSEGNVLMGDEGKIFSIGTVNSLISAGKKPIALIGVEDLIVVDTNDILLICAKEKAQDVKKMVNLLKEKKLDQYT